MMGFWLRMLAYVTGAINRELLLKNGYLLAENRVLRSQIKGRLNLTDEDRRTLASLGVELGRRLLAEVAGIVTPDTIFRWYRDLVAKKFDGSYTTFAVAGLIGLPWLLGWAGHVMGPRKGDYIGWGVLAGFLLWAWGMTAIRWLWVRRRQAICKRIDEWGAVLRLPNATLLQTAWQGQKTS